MMSAPRIKASNLMIPFVAKLGDCLDITVEVFGEPEPDVYWYLGKSPLGDTDNYSLHQNEMTRTLHVNSVDMDLEKGISITARNYFGQCNFDLPVTVYQEQSVVTTRRKLRLRTEPYSSMSSLDNLEDAFDEALVNKLNDRWSRLSVDDLLQDHSHSFASDVLGSPTTYSQHTFRSTGDLDELLDDAAHDMSPTVTVTGIEMCPTHETDDQGEETDDSFCQPIVDIHASGNSNGENGYSSHAKFKVTSEKISLSSDVDDDSKDDCDEAKLHKKLTPTAYAASPKKQVVRLADVHHKDRVLHTGSSKTSVTKATQNWAFTRETETTISLLSPSAYNTGGFIVSEPDLNEDQDVKKEGGDSADRAAPARMVRDLLLHGQAIGFDNESASSESATDIGKVADDSDVFVRDDVMTTESDITQQGGQEEVPQKRDSRALKDVEKIKRRHHHIYGDDHGEAEEYWMKPVNDNNSFNLHEAENSNTSDQICTAEHTAPLESLEVDSGAAMPGAEFDSNACHLLFPGNDMTVALQNDNEICDLHKISPGNMNDVDVGTVAGAIHDGSEQDQSSDSEDAPVESVIDKANENIVPGDGDNVQEREDAGDIETYAQVNSSSEQNEKDRTAERDNTDTDQIGEENLKLRYSTKPDSQGTDEISKDVMQHGTNAEPESEETNKMSENVMQPCIDNKPESKASESTVKHTESSSEVEQTGKLDDAEAENTEFDTIVKEKTNENNNCDCNILRAGTDIFDSSEIINTEMDIAPSAAATSRNHDHSEHKSQILSKTEPSGESDGSSAETYICTWDTLQENAVTLLMLILAVIVARLLHPVMTDETATEWW